MFGVQEWPPERQERSVTYSARWSFKVLKPWWESQPTPPICFIDKLEVCVIHGIEVVRSPSVEIVLSLANPENDEQAIEEYLSKANPALESLGFQFDVVGYGMDNFQNLTATCKRVEIPDLTFTSELEAVSFLGQIVAAFGRPPVDLMTIQREFEVYVDVNENGCFWIPEGLWFAERSYPRLS